MNNGFDPHMQPAPQRDGIEMSSTTVLDMRVIVGCKVSDMRMPWGANTNFSINDLGILEVRANWKVGELEEEGYETKAIMVVRQGAQVEIPNNVSVDRIIGEFTYEDREYLICTANMDEEYTFFTILKPSWRSGGFAFHTTMRLPGKDHFVGSSATMLLEEEQDVSQTRFAAYLSFNSNVPALDCIVAVEPISPNDQSIYDIEIRPVDDIAGVRHFTINGLKECQIDLMEEVEPDDEENSADE